MEKDKHLGLRIDSETHKKLKSLAEFEGRSINGEVLYLIRQAIAHHSRIFYVRMAYNKKNWICRIDFSGQFCYI